MQTRHVPLLVLRIADLERIAWREGKVSALRLERRARNAFIRLARKHLRAADMPIHDRGSELFAVVLCAAARNGGASPLAADCRSALTRASTEFCRMLPVTLQTGWTLLGALKKDPTAFEIVLRTALQRGELEHQRFDFFAGAAHEMRTPLTAIRGYLETVLEESPKPQTARRFLEIARNETLRLGRLIDGMFQVSLLDMDQRGAKPAGAGGVAAIHTAVEAALGALGPRIRERRARINVNDLPIRRVSVTFDHLVQVLINVIGNALDHGGDGVRISITGSGDGHGAILRIEDDGPGIPLVEREAIFTFGYRAGSAGNGLGLALARRLLERCGGAVYATDSALGGAQIIIALPHAEQGVR